MGHNHYTWNPTNSEYKTYKERELKMAKLNILKIRAKNVRQACEQTLHSQDTVEQVFQEVTHG